MKKLHLLIILCAITIHSCSKDTQEAELTVEYSFVEEIYLLDGVDVDLATLDALGDNTYVGVTSTEIDERIIPVINAFTTREAYIQWGEDMGLPVAMNLEVEEHLSSYAEENGIIDLYEQTGIMSQAFKNYQTEYLAETIQKHGLTLDNSRAPTIVRNTCGVVSDYFFLNLAPALPSAHNNQVSAMYHFLGFIQISIYNRIFFRSRIGTFYEFGLNEICFSNGGYFGRYNNRMSSCITLS